MIPKSLLTLLYVWWSGVSAYQIIESGSFLPNGSYPLPYEAAFVGYYGDPTNYQRERINEGGPQASEQEIRYEGVSPRQACPGMVGPFTDGSYYCSAKEFGYCDRRTGTCFCNTGYEGIDCTECTISHYRVGPHCYPKKLCPNDCNGAGACNFNNGTCSCNANRVGTSCETTLCSTYSSLCVTCTDSECLACSPGYYLTGDSTVCSTCYDFDPRCAGCIRGVGCTSCADSTLTSVRRSGYRKQDPPLPSEEVTREFSITLPFGTKSAESFAEAENYQVVSTTDNPLKNNAITCSQGEHMDASFNCTRFVESHIVCGHYGIFTLEYPNYEIAETAEFIRMKVRRTGGGYGDVSIAYNIKHYTTNDSDVVATAFYTTSQTLSFAAGVIERSFLISIVDDNIVEPNEVFQVVLSTPDGGGAVGAQFRANVTIIDDDINRISPKLTYSLENTTRVVAGEVFFVTLQAIDGRGQVIITGGERFLSIIENNLAFWTSSTSTYRRQANRIACLDDDLGNGQYTITCPGITPQGVFQLRNYHAFPHGLKGEYFYDAFFTKLAVSRLDHVVNFTWGTGRIIPKASDYLSIRWTGAILANITGYYSFLVDADDQARLWINGDLILDHFHERNVNLEPSRTIYLLANTLNEVTLEYREINGPAYAYFKWLPPWLTDFVIIDQVYLYSLFQINRSPILTTIVSAETSSNMTECYGDGLFFATSRKMSSFSCVPRDQFGNLRNDGDLTYLSTQVFTAVLALLDTSGSGVGAEIIYPILTFNSLTYAYDWTYIATRAGNYNLSIYYQSSIDGVLQHVLGSPFIVSIAPDQMSGPQSLVIGLTSPTAGGVLYAIAGDCYNFTIIARDNANNLRLTGGDVIQAYAYRVDYFNETTGDDPPSVSTAGSPTYRPTAMPTTKPSSYVSSNRVPITSDSGGEAVVRYGTVSDQSNGNYTVRICPVIAGYYELHLLLGGVGISNQPYRLLNPLYSIDEATGEGSYLGQYIGASPYFLIVSHGVPSVITSTVIGPGLITSTVGVLTYFILTVRDAYDNVIRSSPFKANITMRLDYSPSAFVSVWDYKNGSYLMQYIPLLVGDNLISIFVNGFRIRYAPFFVPTLNGESKGTYSYATGAGLSNGVTGKTSYFTLFAYDLSNNRLTNYDAVFEFDYYCSTGDNSTTLMSPCPYPGVATHPVCDPNESKGGYFFGSYTPTITGTCFIRIYLVVNSTYREEISNSPFTIFIDPSAPNAELSVVTGILHSHTAGQPAKINVQLVDYYQNQLTFGSNDINLELALYCVACDWGTTEPFNDSQAKKNTYNYKGFFYPNHPVYYTDYIVDNQDGSYQLQYTVNRTGEYVIRLSVTETGLNATYFNNTQFGRLFNDDFATSTFINSLRGASVNYGSSISWTGDIGGPTSTRGDLDESSYINRFYTRVEDIIQINASRGIAEYFDFNAQKNVSSARRLNAREQFWSVRYVGLITAPYAERYRFELTVDDDSEVRLYLGGRGVGLNNSDLGTLVIQGTRQGGNTLTGYFDFTDLKYREFLLEYVHYSGDAVLKLSWQSLSTPYQVIPSSVFSHWKNMSHYNLTINPAELCSHCSTAVGKALTEATVAQEQSFVVYGRDKFSNLLQHGKDTPKMIAVGNQGIAFRGKVVDYGNSTYRISYYPTQTGVFRMYIAIGCCVGNTAVGLPSELMGYLPLQIMSSPFTLTLAPAILNVSRSLASGKGLVGGFVDENLMFVVFFRDVFNNPTTIGNVSKLVFTSAFTDSITGDAHVPSVYEQVITKTNVTVTYAFQRAGRYTLAVTMAYYNENITVISPAHVLSSPWTSVVLSSIAADAQRAIVRGLGHRQALTNETASFEIQLYDIYSNKLIIGGNKFFIRLRGDANLTTRAFTVAPSCQDTQNGRYICRYRPLNPGPHELLVKLLIADQTGPGGNGLNASFYMSYDGIGMPILNRIDRVVNVQTENGFMIPSYALQDRMPVGSTPALSLKQMGQRIEYRGYIVAPRSDSYIITVNVRNCNATVFIDEQLVFDSQVGVSMAVDMVQDAAYTIQVQVATRVESDNTVISAVLQWQTATVRVHPISAFFLYTDAEEVQLSPFPVVVRA